MKKKLVKKSPRRISKKRDLDKIDVKVVKPKQGGDTFTLIEANRKVFTLKMSQAKYDATKWQDWINCPYVPNVLKQEISEMTDEEKIKLFEDGALAFGTAGIRGKIGPGTAQLNRFTYQQMMVGYVSYLFTKTLEPKIVIGHDNRRGSHEFALECAKIAAKSGVEVFILENNKLIPTPIISYMIKKLHLTGGVNITASHNPKEDNGFKVYNSTGSQILPNEAKIIIENMPVAKDILDISRRLKEQGWPQARILSVNYDRICDLFFNEVIENTVVHKNEFLDPKANIKSMPIVFTGFQGTTTELMPKFLKKLGFKKVYTVPSQSKISPNFEGSPISNPEVPEAFNEAIKYATRIKSNVIFGCDPDGDRMTIGFKKTNRWRFLNGNELGIIFAHYLLEEKKYVKKPYILSTFVSSSYLDRIANKHKALVYRTKTGFKWMCNLIDKLEQNGQFVVAYEEAIGSLTHTACRDKDSFGAICLALEIMNHTSNFYVDLHDYIQEHIFNIYGATFSSTYSYTLQSRDWKTQAALIMKKALKMKPSKIFDYEIKKVWYNKMADAVQWDLDKDSWIKFRISGTEPKFKIYFCFQNQMVGQLRTAATENLKLLETLLLDGISFKK